MHALPTSFPPVFDGHNDLLLRLWLRAEAEPVGAVFSGLEGGHLDYPRMRQGGFAGGLFAVFVPPPEYVAQMRNLPLADAETMHDPLAITQAQIELFHAMAQASGGKMRVCRTVADIEQCMADDAVALVLHLEGAQAIDAQLEPLDALLAQGVRSIGPFWNTPNVFGEGVSGPFPGSPDTGAGLTPAGKALIRACRERHVLVDVSHMNQKAFFDTAAIGGGPLVATHSNAHALCAQPRNLTDEQLAAIKASDGLVGVNFGTAFLRADGQRNGDTPLSEIVTHVEYLITKLGEDRVAFGSDFDGISLPDAMGDVTGLPRLMQALAAAGFDAPLLEKLAWRNWLRVLRLAWGESQ
ncbi:dipeptidase [Cronobacter turicensis]|uniref:dipeptidase n=1 Tax=Cronobacter turicensis TaxID=413502 RepID=UPI0024C3F744|nr:dipeptidase [Cronobacter turicensis]ELY5851295.1 dipeptidase [Cronobacter turicensis]MDK1337124.1 dipeptidase [Cronobacter turicensis]